MILVIGEERDRQLHRTSWEALTAAQALAGGEDQVEVLLAGADLALPASEMATADVGAVHVAEAEWLSPYTADGHTAVCERAIRELKPRYVLLPHTYRSRDFAPKLAARFERPLISDCVALESGAATRFVRPVYQGKAMVHMSVRGEPPYFVTVQAGAFDAGQARRGTAAVRNLEVSLEPPDIRQAAEPPFREERQSVDLSHANRIVSVGRGIQSQEHVALVERLAALLGAEVGASRPICDSGWLPMERQIGSSGQTVAPQLYVALGISGAIQHVVGMKGSKTIVAVNKDPDAPIFEVADYGIVGDLFEIVPALIAELEKR